MRKNEASALRANLREASGQTGQVELGYILILALVLIPLYVSIQMLFKVLLNYYANISFFASIPYP